MHLNPFRLAAILAGCAVAALAADPIGSVIALQGQATAAGGGAARPLALKGAVFAGDTLKTGPGSRVQVLFSDDSLFSQGENSETVLDEYVFDPKAKDRNTFKASVGRGVFRAVTGKITELNPDRFQIRTGRSTIGIRGCGLLGNLGPDRDEFCVDFVRPGTEILINALNGGPGGLLRFGGPGFGFVDNLGNTGQGPFDPAMFRGLLNGIIPGFAMPGGMGGGPGGGGALAGGGPGPAGGAGGANGNLPLNPLFGDNGQIFLNRRIGANTLLPGSVLATLLRAAGHRPPPGGLQLPSGPSWEYFGYASAQMEYTYEPYVMGIESRKKTMGSINGVTTLDVLGSINGLYETPNPSDLSSRNEDQVFVALDKSGTPNPAFLQVSLFDAYDNLNPRVTLDPPDASVRTGNDDFYGIWSDPAAGERGNVGNRGEGADWVWGEWGVTQTTANAETAVTGVYAAGRTLGAAEVDLLRMGAQVYHLQSDPIGKAAAFVTDGALTRRLDGTANLNVVLGGEQARWEGVFRLANPAGDKLDIDVGPTPITTLGHLQGYPSSYQLLFNGSNHSTPSGGMSGNLVGPGPNLRGLPPVTGAVGGGRFDHGVEGPRVDMTYGTSLKAGNPLPQ